MPKKFKVRLYKQTGYNLTDVPGSKTVLNKNIYEDTEVIMEWQSRVLSMIQVEPTKKFLIEDCDYAMITEVNGKDGDMLYYVGRGIRYLAEGTAVLPLIFDVVGTCLVNNVMKSSIVGGKVARRHTEVKNRIPEPFTPRRPMVERHIELDVGALPGTDYVEYIPLVISSASLPSISQQKTLAGMKVVDDEGVGAIVPTVVPPKKTSVFKIKTTGYDNIPESASFVTRPLPQKILYNGEVYLTDSDRYNSKDTTGKKMNVAQTLRSLGLDSVITAAYSFPKLLYDEFGSVQDNSDDPLSFSQFKTKAFLHKFPFPLLSSTTQVETQLQDVKSRYIGRSFSIQSVASQSSQSFQAWELMTDIGHENKETFLSVVADPSPQGTVCVRPLFIQYGQSDNMTSLGVGTYLSGFYRAVPSIPWNAYTLAAEGGEVFLSDSNFKMQQELLASEQSAQLARQKIEQKNYANDLMQGTHHASGLGMFMNLASSGFNAVGQVNNVAQSYTPGTKGVPAQLDMTTVTGDLDYDLIHSRNLPGTGIAATAATMTNPVGIALGAAGALTNFAVNANQAFYDRDHFNNIYKSGDMKSQLDTSQVYEKTNLKAREQNLDLSQFSAHMQIPTFTSESPIGLSSAFITRYVVTVKDYAPEDKIDLDLMLRMEGNQVNEPYYESNYDKCFTYKSKFNYVRFDQAHINTPYNGDISAEVSTRLISGVRVWHDKVSLGAYYKPNPPK